MNTSSISPTIDTTAQWFIFPKSGSQKTARHQPLKENHIFASWKFITNSHFVMLDSFLGHWIDLLINQVFFPDFIAHQKSPNLLEVAILGSST